MLREPKPVDHVSERIHRLTNMYTDTQLSPCIAVRHSYSRIWLPRKTLWGPAKLHTYIHSAAMYGL